MSYHAAFSAFRKCVVKAGVTDKRVWFHLLKHVSCTEDAKKGMPQSFRNYKHHWTPNSRMNAVYEHLSQSDIHAIQAETWKRIGGVEGKAQTNGEEILLTKNCKRCSYENPRDSAYCNRCGFSLDNKTAGEVAVTRAKLDDLLNAATRDPEKLRKLVEILN